MSNLYPGLTLHIQIIVNYILNLSAPLPNIFFQMVVKASQLRFDVFFRMCKTQGLNGIYIYIYIYIYMHAHKHIILCTHVRTYIYNYDHVYFIDYIACIYALSLMVSKVVPFDPYDGLHWERITFVKVLTNLIVYLLPNFLPIIWFPVELN